MSSMYKTKVVKLENRNKILETVSNSFEIENNVIISNPCNINSFHGSGSHNAKGQNLKTMTL